MERMMSRLVSLVALLALLGFGVGCGSGGSGAGLPLTEAARVRATFSRHSVGGRAPTDLSWHIVTVELDKLRSGGYLSLPEGISIVDGDALATPADADHAYTQAELDALVVAHRGTPAADEALVTALYLDGHYAGEGDDGAVLGLAFGGDAIALFADRLKESCGATGPKAKTVCAVTEAGVVLHEFGHLLGLVNDGTPMVAAHQDSEHGAHCTNPDCIMYYTNDRKGFAELIGKRVQQGNEDVTAFDESCLADLKAIAK